MNSTQSEQKKFSEKLTDVLKKAQQEIDELVVKFTLGKMEASDAFEHFKKDVTSRVNGWKQEWESGTGVPGNIRTSLEELRLQLSLGKAEAKESFEEQRMKILSKIREIEKGLEENPSLKKYKEEFKIESEKIKLQLEILKLKFDDKLTDIKDTFQKEMTNAKIEIDKLKGKAEDQYSNFSKEIGEAFVHLKKAIRSL